MNTEDIIVGSKVRFRQGRGHTTGIVVNIAEYRSGSKYVQIRVESGKIIVRNLNMMVLTDGPQAGNDAGEAR